MDSEPSHIPWHAPWVATPADFAAKAEAELKRLLPPTHVLFGLRATAVGFRQGSDEIVFYLGDVAPHFATVRLTFQPEARLGWRDTTVFRNLDDLLRFMKLDATDIGV